MFPRSQIVGVRHSINGAEANLRDSYVHITSSALLTDGKPQVGGFYDTHMGPIGLNLRCAVCDNTSKKCKGHVGSLTLNQPVWHPMCVSECRKWLKLICFKCGNPFVDVSRFLLLPVLYRLDAAQKFARTNLKKPCVVCGELHPVIKKDNAKIFALKVFFEGNEADKKILLPHKILEIFSRVPDATVLSLGKPIESHPRNYILTTIKIPSVIIRPDIKRYAGGGKSSVDKLTTGFQTLFRKNTKLPSVLPDDIPKKLETAIVELTAFYYALMRTNADEGASIAQRITGKRGRARRNLLGKRTFIIGRDTIAGSSDVAIDEFAIPLRFAKILQVEEIVTAYNKPRIMGYVNNGTKFYPGATTVEKPNGVKFAVESVQDNIEIGDKVLRDLIDGDIAEFNRQPSLRAANLQAHKIRIIRDPRVRVFLINPISVKVYDGDFDGDEMNIIVYPSLASRIELEYLSAVPNWLVNFDNSVPVYGHIEDAIMGVVALTRSFTVVNKYATLWMYKNCAVCPSVSASLQTGREALSAVFNRAPINYTRNSGFCIDVFKDYVKYDASDKTISIKNGRILSGVIDKKSTGSGSPNNIFHTIAKDFTPAIAMQVMHDMQLIGIAVNQFRNTTVCCADLILPKWARVACEEINTSKFVESHMITEKYRRGEIIPPIGKTVSQFYEELQIPVLSPGDSFVDPVARGVDWENNGYIQMLEAGSKGSFNNLYNMVTSVGQRTKDGKRPPMDFGYKRSLPYTKRFDSNPLSRGYVIHPYIMGLSVMEYYWNAWTARVDLILKQLFTSVSGKQARISAINLEALHSNYHRWVVKMRKVTSLMYGEDGMDPRKLTTVKFPTVAISAENFTKVYSHPKFPEFFEQMTEDRAKYRQRFMHIEAFAETDVMSDERKMPMDVAHILRNILNEIPANSAPSDAVLKVMVGQVTEFTDDFAYLLLNEHCRQARRPIPAHLQAVAWLPTMLIRSYLHPNALVELKLTPLMLNVILQRLSKSYTDGLIAPGTAVGTIAATCFSAYLTQFIIDAHRRSAVGGTSKMGMILMSEILSAKDTSKLSAPSMIVPVLPQYATSEVATKEIACTLEAMHLRRFVSSCAVFFEKYGVPVHPKYTAETADIALFDKLNPLVRPPADLLNYCIRFELNPTELILKNISVEALVSKLREVFPGTHIMYTPENASALYLRVYCRSSMFRTVNEVILNTTVQQMLNCLIRGINGIKEANVVKLHRTKINADESTSRETDLWAIKTRGTNLVDVCCHSKVDSYHVTTDSVQELRSVFGIEAARHRIILGMKGIVEISHRHYMVYADEMTWTGRVTNIETSGLKARSPTSVLMQAGSSSPVQVFENAAINGIKDEISGLTAPLMIGGVPKIGTNYGRLIVNEPFVREHIKSTDAVFESAL